MHVGSLIAAGRDCEILDAGPGRVVRRSRHGRTLEREAAVMRHARRHGFPAPEVFDADGSDILMERVDGPSLLAEMVRAPGDAPRRVRVLTALLRDLAGVRAPGWLQAAPGCPGDRLLHRDLHPANVLLSADGPRVVDWADAARGAADADVACTWLLLATTPADPSLEAHRAAMMAAFLEDADAAAARPYLGAMADRRRADRNITDAEKAGIEDFLAEHARP
ncbi:phosphotransferase [Planomonospora sp. ID82291]|uniref:phosphotransferase n=1 Tax=Planomonospora sp. ID82291 TaxID=2738136 RepID=UPI0018C35BA9|nr:phosphotransferase [Planomonospora sp. ID82291]MBG0813128.1 phosphotransferase [Planomonospora sp. ID82291]